MFGKDFCGILLELRDQDTPVALTLDDPMMRDPTVEICFMARRLWESGCLLRAGLRTTMQVLLSRPRSGRAL